jgi:hypothetical protein
MAHSFRVKWVGRFRGAGPGWLPVDSKCNTIMLLYFD